MLFEPSFPQMYLPDADDRDIFGGAYAPPERFTHGEWHKVASYPKAGSDGQPAEVYEFRMPARFFRVVCLPSVNSIGQPVPGFALETGSGEEMGRLCVTIARAAALGMIGVSKE